MTDEKIEEILFQISGKLAGIESKLDTLSETILRHESRLTVLEQNFQKHISESPKSDDNFKTEMLKLVGKALIIATATIASLTGAGALLKTLFLGVG